MAKPIRILIYSPNFYPSIGGLEILVEQLATQFCLEGHSVIIITKSVSDELNKFPFKILNSSNFIDFLKEYLKCTIFFMPNLSLKGIWPYLLFPFKRLVISHNNCYVSGAKNKDVRDFLKLTLMFFAKNISVSKYISKQIWTKSIVIPNCYRNKIFYLENNNIKSHSILFVGRLVSDKGIDDLVKACKILRDKRIQFTLTIVGEGPETEWISDYVKVHNLENSVILIGKRIGKDVANLMNQSSIVVLPSRNEPFGIIGLEALACGCKLIVSDSGALPEVFGKFADVFQTNNVQHLSSVLQNNLNDLNLNMHRNDKASLDAYLCSFSPEIISKKYLSVFLGNKSSFIE